jgi:4-hydroxy 2-oxovalerate aldolase
VEEITPFIPDDRKTSMYVAMACYGEYSLDKLSYYDGSSVEGIRVTFHYNEIEEALEYCRQIKEKGYKLFIQPVGTTSYSDEQLISLIKKVNELQAYSFYLVDTLGLMTQDDIMRMFYLIDHNLDKSINIGFHSHNNLQLSFSNCQVFVRLKTDRTISLDSSVYGMGRGAGNLNTELIANYINENSSRKYIIEPLLEIVDEFIAHIREK